MQMHYDLVILGGGSFTNCLITQAEEFNLNTLIVTDQKSHIYEKSVAYEEFFSLEDRLKTAQLIIGTRFEKKNPELFENLKDYLRRMRETDSGRVVYLSSVAVYPNSSKKMKENDANPICKYGESKFRIERELGAMLEDDFIALRISNLFGAQGISSLEFNIIESLRLGTTLEIPRSTTSRDFVYVQDLVKFIVSSRSLLMEPGIYNFATGISTTVENFVQIRAFPDKLVLNHSLPGAEIQHSIIDNQKIKLETNFEFTTLFDAVSSIS
jgi:nucleoside-diphosphate-sugar epimerase